VQRAPNLISEIQLNVPATFIVPTILNAWVDVPDCETPFIEVETQDIAATWLANPWGESVLSGRRSAVPPGVENYRWSADTGPAGSRSRFLAVRQKRLGIVCVLQQGYGNSVDSSNGRTLNGTPPQPRAIVRVWDADPIYWQYFADSPTLFGGPSGYQICGQVGAVSTNSYGYPPGYCRYFTGYGATGTSFLIFTPDGTTPVASVPFGTNRVSGGIHPACDVRVTNNNAFASQATLTWTTQPVAI